MTPLILTQNENLETPIKELLKILIIYVGGLKSEILGSITIKVNSNIYIKRNK